MSAIFSKITALLFSKLHLMTVRKRLLAEFAKHLEASPKERDAYLAAIEKSKLISHPLLT